jgi:hypothetical protein
MSSKEISFGLFILCGCLIKSVQNNHVRPPHFGASTLRLVPECTNFVRYHFGAPIVHLHFLGEYLGVTTLSLVPEEKLVH